MLRPHHSFCRKDRITEDVFHTAPWTCTVAFIVHGSYCSAQYSTQRLNQITEDVFHTASSQYSATWHSILYCTSQKSFTPRPGSARQLLVQWYQCTESAFHGSGFVTQLVAKCVTHTSTPAFMLSQLKFINFSYSCDPKWMQIVKVRRKTEGRK